MSLVILHVVAASLVLLVPLLWLDITFGRGFWELERQLLYVPAGLAVAHLAGALVLTGPLRQYSRRSLAVATVAMLTTGLVCAAVLVTGMRASRAVLAAGAGLSALLFLVTFLVHGRIGTKLAVLLTLAIAAAGGHFLVARGHVSGPNLQSSSERALNSNLYNLTVRSHVRVVPTPMQSGGALARLWDDYLLATGDGALYRLTPNRTNGLDAEPLAVRIPSNGADFRRDVAGMGLQESWFKVADIHVSLAADRLRLFASYHYWNSKERCSVLRLSTIELERSQIHSSAAKQEWRTLFETRPCLPVTLADGSYEFGGLQVGGRISALRNGTLLLAVGDHEADGVRSTHSYPQDDRASYGKVFAIDPVSGAAEVFSKGHRNPQGLFVDAADRVFETEHGPQGGDELNQLATGANFGWPIVTYGVNYGTHDWPSNPRQGAHDGFAEPLFAWVPSVGISSVIAPTSGQFGRWQGDLLVGSLRGETIFRVRFTEGRVVMVEPLRLAAQVRDMIEGHNGDIVVWSELGPSPEILIITAAGTELSGAALFGLRCSGCHVVGDGKTHGFGPDLAGIVGSAAGTRSGFNYSDALKSLRQPWTEDRLDRFLANGEQFVPGNSMRADTIADQSERKKIIEHLKSAR